MAPGGEDMKALAGGTFWVLRLAGHLADVRKILLGDVKNTFGVVGAGNLFGQVGFVVADVGPAEDVLEHRLLIELAAEVDRASGFGGIDGDRLAVGIDLAGAVGPQQWIQPAMVVAEAMSKFKAE